MDFDVSKYELQDTATLTVKNARGDDDLVGADGTNKVTIEVYSPGSPEGVKALRKAGFHSQARTWRMMREQLDPNDAVNAEREHAQKLADFTKTVTNFPLDPLALYSNPRLVYIAKQVEEFIAKYGNFSKGSSASSPSL